MFNNYLSSKKGFQQSKDHLKSPNPPLYFPFKKALKMDIYIYKSLKEGFQQLAIHLKAPILPYITPFKKALKRESKETVPKGKHSSYLGVGLGKQK